MLRFIPILFFLFLSSCYYNSSLYFNNFKEENSIAFPDKWKNEEIIILEDSLTITIEKNIDKNIAIEKSVKYYYVNGIKEEKLKGISFFEESETEENPFFDVSVLYKNGSSWQSNIFDFSIVPHRYSGEYLTDDKIHMITIPDYSQGIIIRVVEKRNIIMPEFSTAKFVRGKYPTLKKHIKFTHSKTEKWKYIVSNIENLKIDTASIIENSNNKFIIFADSLEKLPDQEIPHPEEWFCGLHISLSHKGNKSHTWSSLGDYYLSLAYRNQEENSQILTDFIAKSDISKNGDPEKIISQAFSFIQNNFRYYANMENEHSFIPRSISEIISKGYGDCKEMSILLQGMLYRLGVKSDLALVGTKESIQYHKEIPTLSAFNHIIVYRKDENGNIKYYDPTVDYGKASNSYMNLIGQKTLLLSSGKSYPSSIKRTKNHKNLFYTKSKIIKDKSTNSWKLVGSISLTGEAAYTIFPYMKSIDKEEMNPFLKGFLKKLFNFDATKAFIDSSSDEFCRIQFKSDFQSNYIKLENGGFRLSTPSLFGGNYRYTTQNREGPKKFKQMRQIDEWILPKNFNDLESKDLSTEFASGMWNINSRIVRREYHVEDIIFFPKDKQKQKDYFKQKKAYLKAIVWR